MPCNDYIPRMQFQNPAYSHYVYGWKSCTAFAAAMAGDYDTCGATVLTGARVRQDSNEPVPDPASPGLNLSQVDASLNRHGIDLDTRYKYPWDQFAARIDAGQGAILQVSYAPIADSRFDAGGGFRGNHAIFVPPRWKVMDPLADGRRSGVYKFHGEAYPESLLRAAAGELVIGTDTNGRDIHVGAGFVYAAFTRDNTVPVVWKVSIHPAPPAKKKAFWRYFLDAQGHVKPHRPSDLHATGGFTAACSRPVWKTTAAGAAYRLVQINDPKSGFNGWWVSASFAKEVPA